NSGLSEAEIQAMVKDAELHAEDDKKAHELADARNQADGMVHMVKKSLTEYGDKLDAAEKATIEAAIKDVEDVLREGDKETITAKTEALSAAAQKLGEKMYAQQQQAEGAAADAAGQQQAGGEKTVEGDVVDAEFTEVNKDKK
ncbi:MAG: Hsp70 family protein, partial [Azonexus sp.]